MEVYTNYFFVVELSESKIFSILFMPRVGHFNTNALQCGSKYYKDTDSGLEFSKPKILSFHFLHINFFTVLTFLTILDNFDNDNDNPRDLWPLRH